MLIAGRVRGAGCGQERWGGGERHAGTSHKLSASWWAFLVVHLTGCHMPPAGPRLHAAATAVTRPPRPHPDVRSCPYTPHCLSIYDTHHSLSVNSNPTFSNVDQTALSPFLFLSSSHGTSTSFLPPSTTPPPTQSPLTPKQLSAALPIKLQLQYSRVHRLRGHRGREDDASISIDLDIDTRS